MAETLKARLNGILNNKELEALIKSYDIIGDIAIVKIPDELKKHQKIIANAILEEHKNIQTVLKKSDIHSGLFRTQKLSHVFGKKTKETVYRENGCIMKLNVEKTYFSPRLSNERKRIANLVMPGEEILVMFSGIAPYALVIAKNTKAKEIYCVELNPDAHKYALENVKLNKLKNIRLFKGDVKKIVPKIRKKFDRILMPLPKGGEDFLGIALKAAKKGTTIHFYDFVDESLFPEVSVGKVKRACNIAKKKCRVINSVKCGQYGIRKFRVCIDFRLS